MSLNRSGSAFWSDTEVIRKSASMFPSPSQSSIWVMSRWRSQGSMLISFKLKKTPPGRQSGIRCHIRMCWHIILRFWIPEIVQESIRPAVKQEGCPLTKTYYSAQSTGYSWWILALYECAIIKSQLFPLKQLAFCNFKVAFAHRIHQLTVVSWISSLSLLNQDFPGFYLYYSLILFDAI